MVSLRRSWKPLIHSLRDRKHRVFSMHRTVLSPHGNTPLPVPLLTVFITSCFQLTICCSWEMGYTHIIFLFYIFSQFSILCPENGHYVFWYHKVPISLDKALSPLPFLPHFLQTTSIITSVSMWIQFPQTWRWRQHVPPKHQYQLTMLHAVKTHKTTNEIIPTMKTWQLLWNLVIC
jgi:hypothetical protein